MENKIILGSANFDQKYGISRNFILKSEIKKLFKSAKKNKITTVDTSPSYNKSEKIIGSLNEKNFKIISKTFVVPKNLERKKIKSWMKKKSIISLKNLKIKKFECLLIHDANSLLGKNGNEIYECSSKKNLKIIDLTGAGDLFASGFLNGHVNGLMIENSLQMGTDMSSKVIQQIGARLD